MAVVFDKINQLITVEAPATEITIQELVNAIRDWQDEVQNMEIENIADGSGKEGLGGGVSVGVTLTLLDWKIMFEARAGPTYTLCAISGGNLVTYDSGTATYINPVEPSAFVTVTLSSSSSATLQELSAIQYASFGGGVTIDVVNGTAGTAYPIGTIEEPVNNTVDAAAIALERGFHTIFVVGDLTLGAGDNVDEYTFEGFGFNRTSIDVDPAASTHKCEFRNCVITGTLDGESSLVGCKVDTLTYFNGTVLDCRLAGPIYLDGGANAMFYDCGTINPGSPCTIDMGGSGQNAMFHDYSGGLKFMNMSDATNMIRVQMDGGKVILDPTITKGYCIMVGIGILTDNSTHGVDLTLNTDGLMSRATIAQTIYDEIGEEIQYASFGGQVTIDVVSGSAGTAYPIGTIENPVDNVADALLIAVAHGFHTLYFKEGTTITGVDITNYTIVGASCVHTQIIIDPTTTNVGVTVRNCDLSGTIDGKIKVHGCLVGDLINVNGYLFDSSLYGTITLGGGVDSNIVDCFMFQLSHIPAIDMGGSGQNLFLSDWSGAIKVRNLTGANTIGCQLDGGRVFLEPTVSAGTVGIVGIGTVVDQSVGGTVDISGLINNAASANAVWTKDLSTTFTDDSAGDKVSRILAATEAGRGSVNDASPSVTKFITTLTETDNVFWDRGALMFTSGVNKGQIRAIKGYNGATKEISLKTGVNTAPADGDTFTIIALRKFLTPDIEDIVEGVWAKDLSTCTTSGTAGKIVANIKKAVDAIIAAVT